MWGVRVCERGVVARIREGGVEGKGGSDGDEDSAGGEVKESSRLVVVS